MVSFRRKGGYDHTTFHDGSFAPDNGLSRPYAGLRKVHVVRSLAHFDFQYSPRDCLTVNVFTTKGSDFVQRCSLECRSSSCLDFTIFSDQFPQWVALILCAGLFVTTYGTASKTSAGYGVQFRREWDATSYLNLNPKRRHEWKILNAKPSNGIMALSRTKHQLAVVYCQFDDEGCWLHLDVFSGQIFDLEQFLLEEE